MPKRKLTDERIEIRKTYVEHGETDFTMLAKMHGVDRRTISKWAEEENWESQRAEVLITSKHIGDRIKRILVRLVNDIEEMQSAGKAVADSSLDRMIEYLDAIEKLDKKFDERGNAILFADKFIGYCRSHPKGKDLIPLLKGVMPDFLRDMNKD